jgi:cell division protein FtsL
MTRLNLILFFALIFSALGLVNSQHKARNLYIELEQIGQAAKQYDQEYGQLQLEQSTWAMHSRVEQIATQQLQMQVPDAKRVQMVTIGGVVAQAKPEAAAQPSVKIKQETQQKTQHGAAL